MSTLRPASTLSEAYRYLDPLRPLEGEWLKEFYVPRPYESSLDPLIDELRLDLSGEDKTILTGSRGSGKSTELARLAEALKDSHLVVPINIESLLNLGDVNYADILVILGAKTYEAAHPYGLRKEIEALSSWYEENVLEKEEARQWQGEAGVGVSAAIASFSLRFSTNTSQRKSTRKTIESNLADLLKRLNDVLDTLRKRLQKPILVIVDGLDKVYDANQVRDLFLQGVNALLEPHCRIVYTVPFSISYTDDFQQVRMSFHRFHPLPNIKVQERNGDPNAEGGEMLRRVLHSRVQPNLLSQEAAELLARYSGGILRELISLARSSIIPARRRRGDQGPIQEDEVEYAAEGVRNTFRAMLTEEQYRELYRILKGGPFTNSPIARQLIHNLSLLAYNGRGSAWWAIHPLVRPLVEEWGREHHGE